MVERGVVVSRETIKLWVNRFERHFADCIRRDRPRPNDKWHLDEVVIPIRGTKRWLCREFTPMSTFSIFSYKHAEAQRAARRFLQRLVVRFGLPGVAITDKLRSYVEPIGKLASNADHHAHKGLNNASEMSHRPTRKVRRYLAGSSHIGRPRDFGLRMIRPT